MRHFFLHEVAIVYVRLKNIVMFYNRVQNMFLLIRIKLFSFGGKILSWAFWTKYVSTMRFIKIYEKSTSGIFLCFWWSSSIIKTYNNFKDCNNFFGKYCAIDGYEDVSSVTLQVADEQSSSSQIVRWSVTVLVLLVENHFYSLKTAVKQHAQGKAAFWSSQMK